MLPRIIPDKHVARKVLPGIRLLEFSNPTINTYVAEHSADCQLPVSLYTRYQVWRNKCNTHTLQPRALQYVKMRHPSADIDYVAVLQITGLGWDYFHSTSQRWPYAAVPAGSDPPADYEALSQGVCCTPYPG